MLQHEFGGGKVWSGRESGKVGGIGNSTVRLAREVGQGGMASPQG